MRLARRALLLSLPAIATACRRVDPHGVLIFAAASTSDALTEVGVAFERQHGGHVRYSFGASGDLARQIEAGAPADLFLSADRARVDRLEQHGRVAARSDYLRNRLVVVVPTSSTLSISSARDLVAVKRLAIGDPGSVPAGAYARAWLERDGVWASLAIIPTLDVRAALAAVESGHADAAIVYQTDARVSREVRVAFEPREQPDIIYPLAVLTRATATAQKFADFAATPSGRAPFLRRGFSAA